MIKPRKGYTNKTYQKIILYIDPEDYIKLKAFTAENGISVSKWFRKIVRIALRKKKYEIDYTYDKDNLA